MYNSPTVLLKGIQARFLRGLATTAPSVLSPIVEEANSDSNKEQYILFNHFGAIKEWTDEIDYSHLEDFDFEIKNKDWQNGFLVDRNTLDDSKKTLGNDVQREIKFALNSWGNFPDKLITEVLLAGETAKAFDGVALFADARPKLGTGIDNLLNGSGATVAHLLVDIPAAMTALRGFKAKNGDPFNYAPKFLAIIPSHLEWAFKTVQETVEISSTTNVLKGTFDYIVNDYLPTTNNSWYLVNANTPFKPFIFQKRKEPFFDMKDEKDKKFLKYFTTARNNAGVGNPVAIIKTKDVS